MGELFQSEKNCPDQIPWMSENFHLPVQASAGVDASNPIAHQ
jgi:hypothetical protein